MKKLRLFLSGSVQGVGFRLSAKLKADELGLIGWVENLADGRVEVEALGPGDKLAEFILWCRERSNSVLVRETPNTFEIRY